MNFYYELKSNLEEFDAYFDDRETLSDSISYLRNINTLYTNLVLTSFDAGLFEDINNEDEINAKFIEEHVDTLISDFGLTKENAEWVVHTICKLYGRDILNLDLIYEIDDESNDFDGDEDYDLFVFDDKDDFNKESTDKYVLDEKEINNTDSINLSNMRVGEKLPKSLLKRLPKIEAKLGIENITLTATATNSWDEGQDSFKLTGEITSDSLIDDVVIFIMVYNSDNQLIGCSFDIKINKKECNGFATFSKNLYIPKEEHISQIIVRPSYNPAAW